MPFTTKGIVVHRKPDFPYLVINGSKYKELVAPSLSRSLTNRSNAIIAHIRRSRPRAIKCNTRSLRFGKLDPAVAYFVAWLVDSARVEKAFDLEIAN